MKVTELTAEQEAILPKYVEMGIKIGLQTETNDVDYEKVKDLIDKHRELCGAPKTKEWYIYDSPYAALKAWGHTGITCYNALYGQHDIGWLAFYLYWRVEHGLIEETDKLQYLIELSKYVGWMWMCNDITIITKRPKTLNMSIKRRGNGGSTIKVLNSTTGPAVEYLDGYSLYATNGLRFPSEYSWIITDPSRRTLENYLKIKNVEIRNEALKLLPADALVTTGKCIHKYSCKIGGDYALFNVPFTTGDRKYLKMKCPSSGEVTVQAVPPETKTCQQALAWREWGKLEMEYEPPLIRT